MEPYQGDQGDEADYKPAAMIFALIISDSGRAITRSQLLYWHEAWSRLPWHTLEVDKIFRFRNVG